MPIDAILCTDTTKLRPKLTNPNRARRVAIDSTSEILKLLNAAGSLVSQVDDTHNFTLAGTIGFNGAVTFASAPTFSNGGASYAFVSMTNAEIKALRASPKLLIAAPGAGKVIKVLSYAVFLKAGTNVLTESTANLDVRYVGVASPVIGTLEATGFIDQSASTMTQGVVAQDKIVAKSNCDNKGVELFNNGAGEYGGNAAADALLYAAVWYSIVPVVW